jgi:transposase-like protein
MMEYHNSRPVRIIGPQREVLTRDNLPPPGTMRWVASRKAQVVAAVEAGLLTIEEVAQRYRVSFEEFNSWRHAMDRAGVAGLRIAALQAERAFRRRHRPVPARPPARLALA